MRKVLSFFWPQTRKIKSKYNGDLEITWSNGRKILDSSNANYSYGALQRVLEKGLNDLTVRQDGKVLLLGLGGGSVVRSLQEKFGFSGNITAVEIDPVVIDIAKTEFAMGSLENLVIVNSDAADFMKGLPEKFDLIIVDLFIDDKVPSVFYTREFCNSLSRAVTARGAVLFNMGLGRNKLTQEMEIETHFMENGFKTKLLENVEGSNILLTATRLPTG